MSKISEIANKTGFVADTDLIAMAQDNGGGSWSDKSLPGLILRAGSSVNTIPVQHTGYHRFADSDESIGGLQVGNIPVEFYSLGGRLSVADSTSLPLAVLRETSGDLSGLNTETWGGAISNMIQSVTVAPDSGNSPYSALETAIICDPLGSGGSAGDILEARGVDLDLAFLSGTIERAAGSTARIRISAGVIADNFFGFESVGPVYKSLKGTLTNYIGFRAGFDHRLSIAEDGTLVNYTGLLIDPPDATNMPVTGAAIAIDIPSVMPIQLGIGKLQKIYIEDIDKGGFSLDGVFAQRPTYTFDTGIAFNIDAQSTILDGAFFSSPVTTFASTLKGSGGSADTATYTGHSFTSTVSGFSGLADDLLSRFGMTVNVTSSSNARQDLVGIFLNITDSGARSKYGYAILIQDGPSQGNASEDGASIAMKGNGIENGIVWDAKSGAEIGIAPARIWFDGTDLLVTVGGTNYIINEGTTK